MPTRRQTPLCALLLFTAISLILSISVARANNAELSASDAAQIYETDNIYTIVRKGKKIGTHTLSFLTSGDTLTVTAKSDIKVTALKIPVFRFNYQSTETWISDQLVSVDSTAKTGKKIEQSNLVNNGNTSQISYTDSQASEKKTNAERIDYATNHWNINAVNQSILFNTIKGVASKVVVKNLGSETLDIKGTILNTTHYEYSGDLQVQAWYDQNNRWVKLLFLGSDGSEISYTIDTP